MRRSCASDGLCLRHAQGWLGSCLTLSSSENFSGGKNSGMTKWGDKVTDHRLQTNDYLGTHLAS